jgi:hypothetical protein
MLRVPEGSIDRVRIIPTMGDRWARPVVERNSGVERGRRQILCAQTYAFGLRMRHRGRAFGTLVRERYIQIIIS